MQPSESDRAALQFIAEGVTELAGFGVAAIGVVRDGMLHTVAVAGDDEASEELRDIQTPVEALLAELENAEDWGAFKFVPHEREGSHLTAYKWIPDLEVADAPDAWHPHDLLCSLLTDADGELRGVLSIDVPHDGKRPGPEQRRILELYARQAERAVITALERGEIARDLAQERAVAEYRSQLVDVLSHEVQNPLTVILHNAELLLEEGHHDDLTVRGLEAIQRGAERIQVMGADLLVLAGWATRSARSPRRWTCRRGARRLRAAGGRGRAALGRRPARRRGREPPGAGGPAGPRRGGRQPGLQRHQVLRAGRARPRPRTRMRRPHGGAGGARGRGRGGGHRRGRARPGVRGVLPLRRPAGARARGHRPRVSRSWSGPSPATAARVDVESAPDVGTRFRVLLPLVG